jgi:hypothetical protein
VAALFRRPLPNATIKDVTKDAGPSRNGSRGTAAGSSAPTGDPPTLDSPSTVRPCEDARRAEYERWLHQVLLQRHLHDGASLRISALVPQLGVLRDRMGDDAGVQTSIDGLQDQLHTVLQELREVARGIYPPLLDEAGLGPALCEVADRVPVPVRVVASEDRFGTAAEGAVYFAVADRLAALPPGDPPVTVTVRREEGELVLAVDGFPPVAAAAMLDRVRPLGGRVTTPGGSAAGRIEMRLPCV